MTTEEQLYLDIIKTIPVLRYQKDPAENIQALYNRYPNGGEYGWYALVRNTKGFVFWDTATSTWEVMKLSDGSAAFASQAEASALEAAASAVAALDSKNAAQTAETNSYNNRVNAYDSQQAALASEQAAKASEEASALSAASALASKDAAVGANNLAQAAKNDAVVAANNSELYASNAVISADSAEASAAAALLSENAAGYANYQAQGYATAAEASKGAAATSAASAGASEATAVAAKDLAVLKGDQALISASNALMYQNEAMAARDLAEDYRDASLAAATSSQEARDKAELWANENENVAVEPGLYSAKHFMLKAEDQYLLAQAEKVAAQTARTGAETARAGAETAEANAELAESNAELAETNAEAARDAAIASAATFRATYPITVYQSRVLADSGVIKDLEELTKLYLNDLELDKSTLFKWSGWSGVKTRTSGSNVYVTKAYDNSTNNNDAVQATEANQPFYAGNIAPNEVGKIKSNTETSLRKLNFTNTITFANTQPWSATFSINRAAKSTSGEHQNIIGYNTGSFNWIAVSEGKITIRNAAGTIYTFSDAFLNSDYGKEVIYTVVYNGGGASGNFTLYKNGIYFGSITGDGAISFNRLLLQEGQPVRVFIGTLSHAQIFNKALSAYEVQQHHTYLRSIYPEIEGVAIGNQYFATSNYEGVVAGDGSVINEVQVTAANAVEKLTNGTFNTDISGWSGFGNHSIVWDATQAGKITATGAYIAGTDYAANINVPVVANTRYKIILKAKSISGNTTLKGQLDLTGTFPDTTINTSSFTTVTYYGIATATTVLKLRVGIAGAGEFLIDDVSVKEVGWDEAQVLYDYVYAATTGTTAVKDLAATKAAAMWKYPNNDVLLGAISGKRYNGWATLLINKFPPKGYRVMSLGDANQLSTYLGGNTVAGAKLKALYGGFNNSYSTNESGFSAIQTGYITSVGDYVNTTFYYNALINGTNVGWLSVEPTNITANIAGSDNKLQGFPIRLLRNEPVGNAEETIQQTIAANTDYASSALQMPMKFGYRASLIRITSEQQLTSVEVKLHNSAGTAVATLISAKTVAAGATMVFPVLADYATLLNDGTLRMTCAGNVGSTIGGILQATCQKEIFN